MEGKLLKNENVKDSQTKTEAGKVESTSSHLVKEDKPLKQQKKLMNGDMDQILDQIDNEPYADAVSRILNSDH